MNKNYDDEIQNYYNVLITYAKHMKNAKTFEELHYYTLDACRMLVKINDIVEDKIIDIGGDK